MLEKRGENRRKREKRKMAYVNNMFFIKDLAFQVTDVTFNIRYM